jgi:hypothetical protein
MLRGQLKEGLAAKIDLSWRGCCAMVRVLYDTQVVQYNAPTTPQPCETFPQFIAMIKWYPILEEHSRIMSSLRR